METVKNNLNEIIEIKNIFKNYFLKVLLCRYFKTILIFLYRFLFYVSILFVGKHYMNKLYDKTIK